MTKFKNVSMLKQIKKKMTAGLTAAIALSFTLVAPLASAQSDEKVGWPETVSYTHLTLPTSDLV